MRITAEERTQMDLKKEGFNVRERALTARFHRLRILILHY